MHFVDKVNFYSLSFKWEQELLGFGSEMIFFGFSSGSPTVLDPTGSVSTTLSSGSPAIAGNTSDAFNSMDASKSKDASNRRDASKSIHASNFRDR